MKLGNKADNFARENAPFIRQAMEEGGSLRKAAAILNKRGIMTPRGKVWRLSALVNVVNRMKALGLYSWSGEEIISSIDTMGFEPAVAYDVPEFGNVHVLMKDGEPWFIGTEIGRSLNSKKSINWLNSYISYHKEIKKLCITLSSEAVRCLIFNRPFQNTGLLICPCLVIKECAKKLRNLEAQKLDKLLFWSQNKFRISYSAGKLSPLVTYRKLEVVFYQHKILITQRSLNACLGSSPNNVGIGNPRISSLLRELIVYIKKDDAIALGLLCPSPRRSCMTIDGAKEYLKTICQSPNATAVLEWIEREVEPAARKHLAALEAQEAKETKEMPEDIKEETPLLFNAETVPAVVTAPAVPTYEELLAPWQATLKAQEDALKELEAVKADLASRVARIDEQNADIKTLVENNNAFQDERRKLNEEIEAKEKEIESLKNGISERNKRIKELEDTVAYQNGMLSGMKTTLKECEMRVADYGTLFDIQDKSYCKLMKAVEEHLDNNLSEEYYNLDIPSQERFQQLADALKNYKNMFLEAGREHIAKIKELESQLAAKDAELAKFKAFKDMMQSFMKEESASKPAEVNTTQSEGDVPPGWVEIAPGVKCTGPF